MMGRRAMPEWRHETAETAGGGVSSAVGDRGSFFCGGSSWWWLPPASSSRPSRWILNIMALNIEFGTSCGWRMPQDPQGHKIREESWRHTRF